MSDSGNAIVATAAGELGRDDDDCPAPGCYFGNGTDWCSEFVSWSYQHAGFGFTGGTEGGWLLNNTRRIRDWFGTNATYLERSSPDWNAFRPTPGDYVYIGRAGDPGREHSGIVESVDASGDLHTIEGNNAGRRVGRYVYPAFRTNSTSNAPAATNGIVVGFGLRCGAQIRLPNGVAGASSSGDDRAPALAFDQNPDTFWRNRTHQTGPQYLEMDFAGAANTVTKVSLTFGNHYPRDYEFRFRIGGQWVTSTRITGNTATTRAHVWFTPVKAVQAVRLYVLAYSADDYFSVYDMAIQR
jgi:hypothetical protein